MFLHKLNKETYLIRKEKHFLGENVLFILLFICKGTLLNKKIVNLNNGFVLAFRIKIQRRMHPCVEGPRNNIK